MDHPGRAGLLQPILTNYQSQLLSHPLSHYLPAFAVTVSVGGAALAAAVLRLRVREI